MNEKAQTYQPQIGDMFENHDKFIDEIKNYAHELGFSIRLGKVEYSNTSKKNSKESQIEQEITEEKRVRKRTVLCSRAEYSKSKEYISEENPVRNRRSSRCVCPFFVH